MFTTKLCESQQDTVTLNGIHAPILELLLDYAYTAEVRVTKSNVQSLLAAANLLGKLFRLLRIGQEKNNSETKVVIADQKKRPNYCEFCHNESFLSDLFFLNLLLQLFDPA